MVEVACGRCRRRCRTRAAGIGDADQLALPLAGQRHEQSVGSKYLIRSPKARGPCREIRGADSDSCRMPKPRSTAQTGSASSAARRFSRSAARLGAEQRILAAAGLYLQRNGVHDDRPGDRRRHERCDHADRLRPLHLIDGLCATGTSCASPSGTTGRSTNILVQSVTTAVPERAICAQFAAELAGRGLMLRRGVRSQAHMRKTPRASTRARTR